MRVSVRMRAGRAGLERGPASTCAGSEFTAVLSQAPHRVPASPKTETQSLLGPVSLKEQLGFLLSGSRAAKVHL